MEWNGMEMNGIRGREVEYLRPLNGMEWKGNRKV